MISEVKEKSGCYGNTQRMPSGIQKGQGNFPGGSGAGAEARRLYKMDRSWSTEEHMEYFSGTKVACVMVLSWAGVFVANN